MAATDADGEVGIVDDRIALDEMAESAEHGGRTAEA